MPGVGDWLRACLCVRLSHALIEFAFLCQLKARPDISGVSFPTLLWALARTSKDDEWGGRGASLGKDSIPPASLFWVCRCPRATAQAELCNFWCHRVRTVLNCEYETTHSEITIPEEHCFGLRQSPKNQARLEVILWAEIRDLWRAWTGSDGRGENKDKKSSSATVKQPVPWRSPSLF